MKKIARIIVVFLLLGLALLSLFLSRFVTSQKGKAVFQSRAAASSGNTISVSGTNGEAIQQAIDSAKDRDTILIPAGVYSGATADPFGPGAEQRGASATCFIKIAGKKNLTLKGEGFYSMIFGEGHDSKAGVDPYTNRAGICVIDSNVVFDNLHVKEFQGRCMAVYNSSIVVKNSTIDGCDTGGISLFGDSTGLIVNNLIAEHNMGGIMLWENSQSKIFNNIFYNGGIMFFYHPDANDQMKAEIINNIIVLYTNYAGRASITQVDWWKDQIPRLKENTIKTNIFWKGDFKCWDFELCDFHGKISADPMFAEPVTDPRGVANWANFGLREGSPAIGSGDPSIPGPKNLGTAGGPCADPNSSICSSFIASNVPTKYTGPAPTVEPTETPTIQPTRAQIPRVGKRQLEMNIMNQKRFLIIENNSETKTLSIKGLVMNDSFLPLHTELRTKTNTRYDISDLCAQLTLTGGMFYASGDDDPGMLRFKNIAIDCGKNQVISIE